MQNQSMAQQEQRRFTVIQNHEYDVVLGNLLRASGEPALAYLAEQYGLRRVPGLSKQALLARIIKNLTPKQLGHLKDDLIAARYGALSVDGLIKLALVQDKQRDGKP